MSDYAIDDAAAAALLSLKKTPYEQLLVLYGDDLQRSNVVTQGQRGVVGGAFKIPEGSLRALAHSHSTGPDRDQFSTKDRMTAQKLGKPSYISAGDKIMRYTPSNGKAEEVLHQIPLDPIRKLYVDRLIGGR